MAEDLGNSSISEFIAILLSSQIFAIYLHLPGQLSKRNWFWATHLASTLPPFPFPSHPHPCPFLARDARCKVECHTRTLLNCLGTAVHVTRHSYFPFQHIFKDHSKLIADVPALSLSLSLSLSSCLADLVVSAKLLHCCDYQASLQVALVSFPS